MQATQNIIDCFEFHSKNFIWKKKFIWFSLRQMELLYSTNNGFQNPCELLKFGLVDIQFHDLIATEVAKRNVKVHGANYTCLFYGFVNEIWLRLTLFPMLLLLNTFEFACWSLWFQLDRCWVMQLDCNCYVWLFCCSWCRTVVNAPYNIIVQRMKHAFEHVIRNKSQARPREKKWCFDYYS